MPHESTNYLWHVEKAGRLIDTFVAEKTFDDYIGDPMASAAVERQLTIIGEALSQLARSDPQLAAKIPELPRIVAFRNILVHMYAEIDDELGWNAVHMGVPPLRTTVQSLLREVAE